MSSFLCATLAVYDLIYLFKKTASFPYLNYVSWNRPVIFMQYPPASVCSYVNCSVMLNIPQVHHPYAFILHESSWIMQSYQCEWGVNLFSYFLFAGVRGAQGCSIFSPPPPQGCHKHLHLPTYLYMHRKGFKHAQRSQVVVTKEKWTSEILSHTPPPVFSVSCCSFVPDGDTWLFDVCDHSTENTTPCSSYLVKSPTPRWALPPICILSPGGEKVNPGNITARKGM